MKSLCFTGSWKLFNQQWTVRSPRKRVRGIESHPFNSFLSEYILMKWFQTLWLYVSWMAKCPLLLAMFYSDQKIRLFWSFPVFDSEHSIWNFPIWMRVIPNFSKHLLVHSNTVPVMILCILFFLILTIPFWLSLPGWILKNRHCYNPGSNISYWLKYNYFGDFPKIYTISIKTWCFILEMKTLYIIL